MTEPKVKEAGLWSYLKEAFTFRWNLLALLGATAAAAISPAPDILLPIVGAVELAYLASLTGIPRFRAAIDAKKHAEKTAAHDSKAMKAARKSLSQMRFGLDPQLRDRFDNLRERCLKMRRLAEGVRGAANSSDADSLRTPALDRLLWVFLRLLYSKQALSKFLESTDAGEIKTKLDGLTAKVAHAEENKDERILRSLRDSVSTYGLRLDNYNKAESNFEFVNVELDRIEGKIQALTEMAVSHEDPNYISQQVDSVASSMAQTEEAIRELNQITGLRGDISAAPEIMNAELDAPPELLRVEESDLVS